MIGYILKTGNIELLSDWSYTEVRDEYIQILKDRSYEQTLGYELRILANFMSLARSNPDILLDTEFMNTLNGLKIDHPIIHDLASLKFVDNWLGVNIPKTNTPHGVLTTPLHQIRLGGKTLLSRNIAFDCIILDRFDIIDYFDYPSLPLLPHGRIAIDRYTKFKNTQGYYQTEIFVKLASKFKWTVLQHECNFDLLPTVHKAYYLGFPIQYEIPNAKIVDFLQQKVVKSKNILFDRIKSSQIDELKQHNYIIVNEHNLTFNSFDMYLPFDRFIVCEGKYVYQFTRDEIEHLTLNPYNRGPFSPETLSEFNDRLNVAKLYNLPPCRPINEFYPN